MSDITAGSTPVIIAAVQQKWVDISPPNSSPRTVIPSTPICRRISDYSLHSNYQIEQGK